MSARPERVRPALAPLPAAALLDALLDGDAGLEHSPLGGSHWLYLDTEELQAVPAPERERILQWLNTRACPVIGLDRLQATPSVGAACDVLVADAAGAQLLIDRIRHAPLAAMTLVQVLRATERLPIEGGLVVESLGYGTLQAGPEFRGWLASRPTPVGAWHAAAPAAPLHVQRSGRSVTITLARPERRNALSIDLRDALVETFALVQRDDTIESVLVRGAGPDFCAGGDLAEFGTTPDPATAHGVRSTRSPAAAIATCGKRVKFHLHGACIGAGVELAAFGREVCASTDAWFQLPELAFGLIPGAGGCVSLVRRIGRQRTAWLALSGQRIDAATALAWGLVDQIANSSEQSNGG